MTFWIAAALLTLGASLAVLLPLTGARGAAPAGDDRDLLVYRDQLAEVERDRERGLIAGDAAAEAQTEIKRRILRLDGRAEAVAERPRLHRVLAVSAVLAVPVLSWGIYGALGSPDLPAQPLSARLTKSPENGSVSELLARAEAHLAANPDDARGWSVLAPIYLRLNRFDDAASAYRNAIRSGGATADREAGLGEALAAAAGGLITRDAEAAFKRALALEPGQVLARFQLAGAQLQAGKADAAVAAWNAILPDLAPDSPWRGVIAQATAEARPAQSGPAAGPPRGPSREQVAAAETMPEGERAEMIAGMVAGLDQRLRANPQDADGWMRLVRSYLVLERPDDAREALQRGRSALGEESENGRKLLAFAESLGLTGAQP